MLTPVTNDHLIGKKVALAPEAAEKDKLAALGVDEATALTISAVNDSGVSFSAVRITVRNESGNEYVIPAGDLLIL